MEDQHPETKDMSKVKARQGTQYFAALVASLGGFANGCSIGWVAISEPQIHAELQRPNYELTWITSMLPLGGASVMMFLPFVLDRMGRKPVLLLGAFLLEVAWIMICVASQLQDTTTAIVVYCLGQFIAGISNATFCVTAPMYIGEVAQKDMRGKLAVFFELFLATGILYSFVIGSLTSILGLSMACGVLPLTFVLLLLFIPETPQCLLMKNEREKAKKSLTWFRGGEYDVVGEMHAMEITLLRGREEQQGSFCKNLAVPGAKKALVIGVGAMLCQIFCGIFAIGLHTKTIFDMTGSKISSNDSLIIIGVLQIVATGAAALVMDKLGRKYTLFVSMAIMGVCHVGLGVYFLFYAKDKLSVMSVTWLPLLFISVFYLAYSFGAGPTPYAIIGEIFPNNIKNIAVPICIFVNWFLGFVVAFTFPLIIDVVGDAGPFWLYSCTCVVGAVFAMFVCVETKGKTLQEIQEHLAGSR